MRLTNAASMPHKGCFFGPNLEFVLSSFALKNQFVFAVEKS